MKALKRGHRFGTIHTLSYDGGYLIGLINNTLVCLSVFLAIDI